MCIKLDFNLEIQLLYLFSTNDNVIVKTTNDTCHLIKLQKENIKLSKMLDNL